MPSGKTHNKATLIVSPVVAMSVGVATGEILCAVTALAGCLFNIFMPPDLDVDGRIEAFYVVRKYFGVIIERLWLVYWWPYSRLVPHRHFLSHWPVIGTAVRVAYLAPLLYVLGVKVGNFPLMAALMAVVGLAVADALHFFMDITMDSSV